MTIRDRISLLIEWLRNEPVVCRMLASQALTFLASWGVDLSAEETLVVGGVLAAIAARLTRKKVTPVRSLPVVRAEALSEATEWVSYQPADPRALVDAAYNAGKSKKSKPQIT